MPSVKQEAQEQEENGKELNDEGETDGSDISDGEGEEGLERPEADIDVQTKTPPGKVSDNMEDLMCQIEGLLGDGKVGEEEIVQPSFKCCECDTLFTEKDDLSIHIGGVHMEEELLTLLSMVFVFENEETGKNENDQGYERDDTRNGPHFAVLNSNIDTIAENSKHEHGRL